MKPTIATPVCPPDSLRSSPSNAFGPSFGTDFSLPGAKAVYAPAARARRSTRAAANVDGAALAAGADGAALTLAAGGALEPFAGDLPLEAWPFWPFMGSASSESDAASVAFPALALPAALVGVGRCGAGLLLGRAGGMGSVGTDAWTPKASFRATKPEGSK